MEVFITFHSGFTEPAATYGQDMIDETQLLERFAAGECQDAFADLVKLHVHLVYATALRQLGNRSLAEEVTQNVFQALARNTKSLLHHRTLAGWLHRTTLNQSRQVLRGELRRARREQIAVACAEISRQGSSTQAEMFPLLDEALLGLGEKDRLAVLLHYVEGRPFREVGEQLGVGEDAARKRVKGAIEWLTAWFRRKGLLAPVGGVAAVLSNVPQASASLVAAACAIAPTAIPAGAFIAKYWIFMASTKTKLAVAGVALALIIFAPVVLRHAAEMADGNNETTPSPDPQGTAPSAHLSRVTTVAASDLPNTPPPTGRVKSAFERVNEGDESLSLLSRDQAEAFVARNRTNAESLLAAYRTTHDLEYLRLAATKFPNDPAVLMRVVAHNAFPEATREWVEKYKTVDPANSLPFYLSAADHLKSKDYEAAFQDLAQASQKGTFQDRVTENILTLEEAYLAAGYAPADAKAIAACAVELPHLPILNEMRGEMTSLIKNYQQAGDSASAENLAAMGLRLAGALGNIQEGGNLLGQIVAVRAERSFLELLEPARSYPFLQGTTSERIAAGNAREQALRADAQFVNSWVPTATEPDIVNYFDRLKVHGELAAIDWLRNRGNAVAPQ